MRWDIHVICLKLVIHLGQAIKQHEQPHAHSLIRPNFNYDPDPFLIHQAQLLQLPQLVYYILETEDLFWQKTKKVTPGILYAIILTSCQNDFCALIFPGSLFAKVSRKRSYLPPITDGRLSPICVQFRTFMSLSFLPIAGLSSTVLYCVENCP